LVSQRVMDQRPDSAIEAAGSDDSFAKGGIVRGGQQVVDGIGHGNLVGCGD
jgi:hypothetical protein